MSIMPSQSVNHSSIDGAATEDYIESVVKTKPEKIRGLITGIPFIIAGILFTIFGHYNSFSQ